MAHAHQENYHPKGKGYQFEFTDANVWKGEYQFGVVL